MSDAPDEFPIKPDRKIREPDDFWDLILHSSRDEQKHHGHNASLSVLCHGFAEPRVPRDQKPKKAKSTTYNSKDAIKNHVSTQMTKLEISTDTTTHYRRKPKSNNSNEDRAKQTKSESSVSDLDIVFVKDSTIPTSEQLGQFAITNRQQKQGHEHTVVNLRHILSAQISEAIYERFEHRLVVAKKEKDEVHKREKNRVTVYTCDSNRTTTNRTNLTSEHKNDDRSKSLRNTLKVISVRKPKPALALNHALSLNIPHDLHETLVRESNPRMVMSRKNTRKYSELKTDYVNICYQESSLHHQIGMMQAEIYMMQAKCFHKTPAVVKTINMDSKYAHLPQNSDVSLFDKHEQNIKDNVFLNTRMKAPKPLVGQQNLCVDKAYERWHKMMKEVSHKHEPYGIHNHSEYANEGSHTGLSRLNEVIPPRCACSMYSLPTSVERPPKRKLVARLVPVDTCQIKVKYRLPNI